MKHRKDNSIETVPKSYRKILERGTTDTPNSQIHDRSRSLVVSSTSIKNGRVKLVLWAQTVRLS